MTQDNAKEDLAYIRRLMADTRQAAYLGGGYFIVWGAAIGAGLLATWLVTAAAWPIPLFAAWTACIALGGVGTFFLIRQEMREPVEAPAGKLIGMVWMAMGITMMIIFFIGVGSGHLGGQHMPALSSALVGGAMFLTGTLAGMNWLRNLSIGWWAGAAIMFAWPGLYVIWLNGLMMLLLYVVPGFILIRQKRRAQQDAAHG